MVPIDNPMSPASQIQEAMDRQRGVEPDPGANHISTEKILFVLRRVFRAAGGQSRGHRAQA